jgi:hypothetical protein
MRNLRSKFRSGSRRVWSPQRCRLGCSSQVLPDFGHNRINSIRKERSSTEFAHRFRNSANSAISLQNDFAFNSGARGERLRAARDLTANDNGANRWHLYEDLKQSNKFRMEVVVPSWKQHLLQLERMTKTEKDILLKLRNLRIDPNPSEEWISLSVEKEVLNRRVRTGGLPLGYIDQ